MLSEEKLKIQLQNKPYDELKGLARKAKIKGFSKARTKKKLIALLLKNKKKLPEFNIKKTVFHTFWKGTIAGILLVTVAIIAHSIKIYSFFSSKNEKNLMIKEAEFSTNDSTVKILILPFSYNKKCNIEDVEYENFIKRRYKKLKENEHLNIEYIEVEKEVFPQTHREVSLIGKEKQADIVLWGFINEECEGPAKIKLKHTLIRDIGILKMPRESYSDFHVLNEIDELENGFLQNDIDYIIYKTLGIIEFTNSKYENAINYFSKINKQCEIELTVINMICFYKRNQITELKREADMFNRCTNELVQNAVEVQSNRPATKEQVTQALNILKNFIEYLDVYLYYVQENPSFYEMTRESSDKIQNRFNSLSQFHKDAKEKLSLVR